MATFDPPASVAVKFADVVAVTARCPTGKFAEVAPAGIITVAGTVAAPVSDEVNATDKPPAGAGLPIRTVPTTAVADPPTTDVGLRVKPTRIAPRTVMVAVLDEGPRVAVRVTIVSAATARVVIGKVAVVAPAGTVTEAGTAAAGEDDRSPTTVPPAGAGTVSVTVPVSAADPPYV